jgi:DNA-binding transcriptional LysR family regulator
VDVLAAFRVLVCVAERGSFSAAARELGVGQPAVSRQMAALEAHLGTRLFNRSAASLGLSDDGLALLDRARLVVQAVDEAQDLVRLRGRGVGGRVRIAGPVVFGRTWLIPKLAALARLHPQLEFDVVLNDSFVDLAEEGVDLAIRVGEITDRNLIARPLMAVRRVAIAAPTYLARRGVPTHPRDLAQHDCVVYTRLATGSLWRFESEAEGESEGEAIEVEVAGPLRVNNSAGVLAAVTAGAGIGVVPLFTLTDQVERGEVQLILERFEPRSLPMHLVYASRHHMPAKIRLTIDYLIEQAGALPG